MKNCETRRCGSKGSCSLKDHVQFQPFTENKKNISLARNCHPWLF